MPTASTPAIRARPGAELVREVHDRALLAELDLDAASPSGLGSGGMRSKVVAASMAAGGGVACVIASGAQPGTIARAVAGRAVGTRFTAARRPVSAWKLWLRYGKPPAGRVFVDAGARTALLSRGASLLPSASSASRGASARATRCACARSRARCSRPGVVAMGSAELRRAAGSALGRRRGPRGHSSR